MGSFILTLCAVALINGAVSMISPEGDMKKYVRLVGALCMLLAIISPVYTAAVDGEIDLSVLFSGIESEENYEEMYGNSLTEGSLSMAEDALKSEISDNFGISSELFDVSVAFSETNEKKEISEVTVFLHSSAVLTDPRDICAYVNDRAGCNCTVIYD